MIPVFVSRAHIMLAGLCTALFLLLVFELLTPPAMADIPQAQWQPRAPGGLLAMALPFPASESFAVVDARPLFDPARRPVAAYAMPIGASAAPQPPGGIALIGVIIAGDTKLALLRTAASPLETSVPLGGSIGGWQVAAIDPTHVTLRSGTADFQLDLDARRDALSAGPADGALSVPLTAPVPKYLPSRRPDAADIDTNVGDAKPTDSERQ
jgi:hypothetical protein